MPRQPSFLSRHANAVFSLKTFAAAILALLIALWMELPRPYWAMATVYITSQPLSGATSSKAFYRVCGTLLGAVATVALVPNLVNAPELLSLAIALWTGACLYLSLLDRTPRSYLFMLAGYTAALIGFPAVTEPQNIFDIALARVEEITLGIVCATIVSTVVLPRQVGPAIAYRIERWLREARGLAPRLFAGLPADRSVRAAQLKLAAEAVEIDGLATHLAYDRSIVSDAARWVHILRLHMLLLLPLLSSVADRLAALGEGWRAANPRLADLVDEVARWIVVDDETARVAPDGLRQEIAALQPKLGAGSPWPDIVTAGLLIRLRELVDISHDCRVLMRHIGRGGGPLPTPLAFHPDAAVTLVRHRDHGMALWSSAGTVIAILVCCAFWIVAGWADGASAPMMAAIGCSFFATMDDPVPAIVGFAKWTAVSLVVVGVYLFGVLPAISNVEMLVLALAPSFLLFGLLIPRPQTMIIGMALAANTATLMALQETYSADFEAFANSGLAALVGMGAAAVVIGLCRSIGAEWTARRILMHSRALLADAADRRAGHDKAYLAGLMLDRIGVLAPRLAAVRDSDLGDVNPLGELRVGLNIVDLRRARHALAPEAQAAVDDLLRALATDFRSDDVKMSPALLARIDHALSALMQTSGGDVEGDALLGLVGIRQGLFPDAPAYRPEPPCPVPSASLAA